MGIIPSPFTGRCRHCGETICLHGNRRTWYHTHTNTRTKAQQRACGFDGSMGTSAEPSDDTVLLVRFAGSPAIAAAENALRSAAGRRVLTRELAEQLLDTWTYVPDLSAREVAAVLARFGPGDAS